VEASSPVTSESKPTPPAFGLLRALPTVEGLLLMLAFLTALTPVEDSDLFLHLATGRYVLEQGVPRVDPFSHTLHGKSWLAHEWLAGTLLELLHRAGGAGLLVWMKACLAVVVLLLVRQLLISMEIESATARAVAMFAMSVAMKNVLSVRPHLATLVFLPATWLLLQYAKKEPRWLVLLVPMVLLWTNCHGGFILVGLPFGMMIVDWLLGKPTPPVRALVLAGICCLAAALVNPQGYHMLAFPFRFNASAPHLKLVDEWSAPDFKKDWPHEAVLLSLILCPLLWPVRPSPGTVAGLLAGLHLSLQASRNQFLVGLLGAPILAGSLASGVTQATLLAGVERRVNRLDRHKGTLLPVVLLALALLPWAMRHNFVENRRFPAAAARWIRDHHPPGNLLNEYDTGGYLIWSLKDYPVFIDGRIEIYQEHGVLTDYLALIGLGKGWLELLDRYRIQVALLTEGSPLARALETTGWPRTFAGHGTVVLTRPLLLPQN
jgi:hypothetical protein